ncbi:hypothetical protein K3495_g7060 [Podosphaera aphanis]|nr:hypothetical protein K3495_g7060 [Podosphaera aphanis]
MTWATLDIDGRAERVFGYIVANLQYNIVLGKGWAERNNVTYEVADEDGILPESKPGWDHSINLELDDEGKPKELPSGPLYGMSRDELLILCKTLTDHLRKARKGWIRASNSPANAPQLSKAQYFTKLDVCTAFHRLHIRPGDEWKTAFRTRYGQYDWLVMPFGLCGGPATFQRYINAALQDILDEYCSAYMDDVIIYSDGDLSDHFKKAEEVIRRLEESGLRLDINKCTFATSEVKYLGFVIKAGEGVAVNPAKIEAIKNWEKPAIVFEARSFLGFPNFYREFIPKISAIAQPLMSLTSKQTRWSWDTKEKEAFEKLKSMLSSAPLLAFFSAEKETYLEADASGYAIGGVLSQIDEKNRLRPVGYFSRKLTPAESNYNIHDKELLAIITTMRHFDGKL